MDSKRLDQLVADGPPPMPDTTVMSACCPICGQLCDTVYLDPRSQALGCDRCVAALPTHDYVWVGNSEGGEADG